jgi:hypothetical protein
MHGNEQIINELLGKYVHRLNKSTRQQFLVSVAARRCDDDNDSNSEGSSVAEEVGGIDRNALPSSEEQITGIARTTQFAGLEPTDASPDCFKPSNADQRRSSPSGEHELNTILASIPMKEQKPIATTIPRVHSSPLLRRAEALSRKTLSREDLKAHPLGVSSIKFDHDARRVVLLPNRPALDLKLSKSLSMKSSSFADVDDCISVAASVMSTASIQSALYLTTTASEDSQPNVERNYCHTNSTSEQTPRLPMRGSYVHATYNKNLLSNKCDMDDASTVTTEATSMYSSISLSRSISFETAASYEVLQVAKSKTDQSMIGSKVSLRKNSRRSELDRLRKLTLIRPTNYESRILNQENKSLDDFMSNKIEKTPVDSMGYNIDEKPKEIAPTRTSLKDLKSKRYGSKRVPGDNNTLSVTSDCTNIANVETQTANLCITSEVENRPRTAVATRALLRRSTTRASSAKNAITSASIGRARPLSMSPLRTVSPREESSIVDEKALKSRLSDHYIRQSSEGQTKGAMNSVPMPVVSIEIKSITTAMSSRAERRRSRSVSRSRNVPPSSPTNQSSSALMTSPAPSHLGTPPRSASKRLVNKTLTPTTITTPPKMMPQTAASNGTAAPSALSSLSRTSLMKSALVKMSC